MAREMAAPGSPPAAAPLRLPRRDQGQPAVVAEGVGQRFQAGQVAPLRLALAELAVEPFAFKEQAEALGGAGVAGQVNGAVNEDQCAPAVGHAEGQAGRLLVETGSFAAAPGGRALLRQLLQLF